MTKRAAWTPEKVRQRIRTGVLVNRLKKHALGQLEMSATQLKAAEILLRKSLPDLTSVNHTGSVAVTYDAAVGMLLDGRTEDASSPEPTIN